MKEAEPPHQRHPPGSPEGQGLDVLQMEEPGKAVNCDCHQGNVVKDNIQQTEQLVKHVEGGFVGKDGLRHRPCLPGGLPLKAKDKH